MRFLIKRRQRPGKTVCVRHTHYSFEILFGLDRSCCIRTRELGCVCSGMTLRTRVTCCCYSRCRTVALCVAVLLFVPTAESFLPHGRSHTKQRPTPCTPLYHSPSSSPVDSDATVSTLSQSLAEQEHNQHQQERALGLSVLLTVPFAWGTYTPVVKYLYALNPPVPGLIFSASYYGIAAVTLWTILLVSRISSTTTTKTVEATTVPPRLLNSLDSYTSEIQKPVVTTSIARSETSSESSSEPKEIVTERRDGASTDAIQRNEENTATLPWQGGMELGSYLFIGNVLQVIGLATVPAGRAGFLVQLTTVIVPILQAIGAGTILAVPLRTWCACGIAFLGVVIINIDGNEMIDFTNDSWIEHFSSFPVHGMESLGSGDALILSAAVVYSLHVVRLERYAKESTALQLATAKATVEAVLGTILVIGLAATASVGRLGTRNELLDTGPLMAAGREITTFWSTISDSSSTSLMDAPPSVLVPAIGVVLWTGWITCAYTIAAQSYGQSRVRPTDANLIYSIQPLCTAFFAYLLLGETLGPVGVIGGALIATAVLLVATTTPS